MTENPISLLVDEWQQLRAELREIEAAEHPDLTDVLGRVWKWWQGDLYTHDGMAWPQVFVERAQMSLPTDYAIENPNYRWCSICRAGR